MTESSTVAAGSMFAPSPGALLRRARQAQGLHIAALAAALKVTPRKLELLEGDEFDKLPDIAFARALAQAVCRHLKIDAPPVLALLPVAATAQPALERVTQGLKTPFREHASQRHESGEAPGWLQMRFIVPALLVLAAVAFLIVPKDWIPVQLPWHGGAAAKLSTEASGDAAAQAVMPPQTTTEILNPVIEPIGNTASAPEAAASAPAAAVVAASAAATPASTVVAPQPVPVPVTAAPPAPPAPLPPGMLALRAAAESWVEVVDGAGDVLIARVVAPGEAVAVNGEVPMRLTVGNGQGMQLRFKGRPVVLPLAQDRTARVVLR